MNKTNKTDTGESPKAPAVPNPLCAMKIKEIKLRIIIWPAEIFAKSLIINAKGFVKTPTSSMGIIIGISANGTPGGLNICPQ